MGHEGAGYVRAVGDDVTSVEPGDQVVLGRIACGRCEYCRMGRSNLCERRRGASEAGTLRTGAVRFSLDGDPVHHCHGVSSFTEHTLVTEEVAIRVTDELPIEQASLLGCGVFTGAGAVMNTVDVEAGATVAVFGCGGVGLSAVQAARLRGAGEIIGVDVVPEKLERATRLGATETVDSSELDPVERIHELTDGGVDYAFEVVGNPTVIEQTVGSLDSMGTAVLVGVPPAGTHETSLDFFDVVTREQRIVGSFNGSYNLSLAIPRIAELVADGAFELEPLVTGRRPLDEVNEAMEELETGTGIRQLVLP
jgi:S-(hydroxymethyl)glutathione dehydrogenase/alcohol dehydrogenase